MFTHHHWQANVSVNNRQILHIAAFTYVDSLGVAAQNRAKPNTGMGLQGDGTHDLRSVSHPSCGVDLGGVVVKLINGHGDVVRLRFLQL
jgi:hypothetical protein